MRWAPLLWIASTAIWGCNPERAQTPDEPKTITVLLGSGSADWVLTPMGNFPAMHLLYTPLLRPDEETGEPRGLLTRSWETSADGRTWTFRLRSDVRWHDGAPFTAHDVAFTEALMSHPDVGRRVPGHRTVHVVDDTTFTITYARFEAPLNTWRVFLPRHLLEGLDPATLSSWEYWLRPIGYGPYRWVRTVEDTHIELEANPDYFEGKPRIDRVILKLGGDPRIEFAAGNIDATGWPPVRGEWFQAFESDARLADIRTYCTVEPTWTVTYLDLRDPILSDRRVRQALRYAIDRPEIAVAMELAPIASERLFDVPASVRQFRRGELPAPVPFDPDRATWLLEEAGWTDVDGDGVRERGAEPLRLRAVASADAALFTVLQQQLRRVGIALEIVPVIESVGRERFRTGQAELFDVEGAGQAGRGLLLSLIGRDPRNDLPIGFEHPGFARLVESLETTFDLDDRDSIYREMWPIFLEEAPVLFWNRTVYCAAAHRRVRGLISPWRWSPETSMADLWIEEEPST